MTNTTKPISRDEYRQIITLIKESQDQVKQAAEMINQEGIYHNISIQDMAIALSLKEKAKAQLKMLIAMRDDDQFAKYRKELNIKVAPCIFLVVILLFGSCTVTHQIGSTKGTKVCHEQCYFKSIKNN